jgi:DinB superfamily
MDNFQKEILWNQFGAAIDMLENAIAECPEEVWGNIKDYQEFWYLAYHTLFWLDFYLSDSPDNFTPPSPFTLSELDPEGLLPERIYTKEEMLNYLSLSREKCRNRIGTLTDETAKKIFWFGSVNLPFSELLLYNMRHVQHHTAQLNLLLRQKTESAPGWVKKTPVKLTR